MNSAARRRMVSLSELAGLVADGAATTRSAIVGATGLSRAAIAQRVDLLIERGVLVDNDVNTMALGEYTHRQASRHLLYVKVGTGIGCGVVSDGVLHRGASGAAGDIGHIQLPGHEDVLCHCGNTGCVEAVASGAA